MTISPESKDMLSMVINAVLYWILWFVILNFLFFLEWAYSYHSLDFNYWWWHNNQEGSFAWGILTVIVSFPLAFFIVKKLKIKL